MKKKKVNSLVVISVISGLFFVGTLFYFIFSPNAFDGSLKHSVVPFAILIMSLVFLGTSIGENSKPTGVVINKKDVPTSYLAKCGHNSLVKDNVSAFGETIKTEVSLVDGQIEYCHKCLSKMAIKCAWCGKPIFIGDPVTLYTPSSKEFKVPEWATIYSKEPLSLVGCGRTDCADTGADYCGVWIPPGEVKRRASAIEVAMMNPGHAVVGNANGDFKLIKMK